MKNGEILDAVSQEEGLASFSDWFEDLPGEDKVLVAHNNRKFDSKILQRNFLKQNFPGQTFYHSDSMDIMKKVQRQGMRNINTQCSKIGKKCNFQSTKMAKNQFLHKKKI